MAGRMMTEKGRRCTKAVWIAFCQHFWYNDGVPRKDMLSRWLEMHSPERSDLKGTTWGETSRRIEWI